MKRVLPLAALALFGAAHGAAALPNVTLAEKLQSSTQLVNVAYNVRVERAQRMLNRLGYEAGPVDGLMGSRTRSALRAFQDDQDLAVTGGIDRDTMVALRSMARGDTRTDVGSGGHSDDRTLDSSSTVETRLIVDTQVALRRRGFDIQVISGELDPATRAAIRQFQRAQNLLVTGRPSNELLQRIHQTDVAEGDVGDPNRVFDEETTIRSIQTALNTLGYEAGRADGKLKPKTRSAIRTYQADANLDVDGEADYELLNALELAVSKGGVQADAGSRVIIADNFNNGSFSRPVSWQVYQGDFTVRNGGLYSSVETVVENSGNRPEDLAKRVISDVFSQVAGISVPLPQQEVPPSAAIGKAAEIPNAFRVRARVIGDASQSARFAIGLYQTGPNQGYRLAFDGVPLGQPTILATSQTGDARIVTRGTASNRFTANEEHEIEWVRDRSGLMTVSLDGRVVASARDTGFQNPFNGIVLINAGGNWSVDNISVETLG